MIFLYIAFSILTYVIWTVLHEVSHIAAANALAKISDAKIMPYPHVYERDGKKHFVFARATWRWVDGYPSNKKRALVSLAPRFFNLLACLVLVLVFGLAFSASNFLLIFCLGGLVDLAVGSIGYREKSDLRKAATYLSLSPWIFRVVGWLLVLSLGIPTLVMLFTNLF